MSGHFTLDAIADAAFGLPDEPQAAAVEVHVASCERCHELAALLGDVTTRLAAEPIPNMPAAVFARLDSAIADESARRGSKFPELVGGRPFPELVEGRGPEPVEGRGPEPVEGRGPEPVEGRGPELVEGRELAEGLRPELPDPPPPSAPRLTLGNFDGGLNRRAAGKRWFGTALLALALATLVGFGGYVLSARSGTNEPFSASSTVAVAASDLEKSAAELADQNLPAHRFSRAWSCVRTVTNGRITGLAPANVDGEKALVVHTRKGGTDTVTLVTGCSDDDPKTPAKAISSVVVKR